jgi:uncharacterized protein YjhX (UPF0386 family)
LSSDSASSFRDEAGADRNPRAKAAGLFPCPFAVEDEMDISREEQRVLHALAQGGEIRPEKCERGRIRAVRCVTRDGWTMGGLGLALFRRLKRRRAIASQAGKPYRITRRGLELVRSQHDNR